MRFIKALLILALFIFGLLFFTQNQDVLSSPLVLQYDLFIENWSWSGLNVPFYAVVLAAFAIGSLLTLLVFFMDKLRSNMSLMSRGRTIRMLEREVTRLQTECEVLNQAKQLPPGKEKSIEDSKASKEKLAENEKN